MVKLTCSKKGISTIIGGFIFLVILVSAFTAFIVAFQIMTDLMEAQVKIGTESITKAREEFSVITSVKPSQGNRLYVQVENTGNTPIQISDAWIVNKTSSPYAATLYEIAYQDSFIAPGSTKNIFENTAVTLQNKYHDIKVVSSIGTVVTDELIVPLRPLNATLFVAAPNLSTGQNATIMLEVVNRGNATVTDVFPGKSTTAMVDPSDSISDVSGPFPSIPIDLEPQESVTFKWNYVLFGAVGTTTTFTNNATGVDLITGDTVSSPNTMDEVKFVPAAKSLLQTPEINMVVPFPFGETGSNNDQRGIWGVIIANPTDQPIDVSRIVISSISPAARTGFIQSTCGSFDIPIPPTVDGEWSCPVDNILQWVNLASPETVAAHSATPFLVRIDTGAQTGTDDDPAIAITASVFSTFGQSARAGLITGIEQGSNGPIVNVYLSDPSKGSGGLATDTGAIIGLANNIESGKVGQMFNVTLADFANPAGANDGINDGTLLVINIPAGFRNVAIHASSDSNLVREDCNGAFGPTITDYPDGSTQITSCVDADRGVNSADYDTLVFTTDVPFVSSTAVYVFTILATGDTTGGFPIGSIAESPVVVVP